MKKQGLILSTWRFNHEKTGVQFTIWLFNIAMEHPNHKWRLMPLGKPSVSMGHLYHGELLVIARGQPERIGVFWYRFLFSVEPTFLETSRMGCPIWLKPGYPSGIFTEIL